MNKGKKGGVNAGSRNLDLNYQSIATRAVMDESDQQHISVFDDPLDIPLNQVSGIKGTATKTENSKFRTINKSSYLDDDDRTFNNDSEPKKPRDDSEVGGALNNNTHTVNILLQHQQNYQPQQKDAGHRQKLDIRLDEDDGQFGNKGDSRHFDMGIPPSRLTLKSEKSTAVPGVGIFKANKNETESEALSDFDQQEEQDRRGAEDAIVKNTIIEDNYSDRL